MNNKEKDKKVVSDKEKLEYVIKELFEGLDLLFVSIRTLYKEEGVKNKRKLYYPIAVLLLCFCFLDFLRRFDYIFKHGKDGNENKENRDKYINLLNRFIINNNKYREYNYSFKAEDLYEIRSDLVHSFGLKYIYGDGKKFISFIGGDFAEKKEAVEKLKIRTKIKHPSVEEVHIITIKYFLEIIKDGLKKMLNEHKHLLLAEIKKEGPKPLIAHLDDLYNELKNTTRYYFGIKRPPSKIAHNNLKS